MKLTQKSNNFRKNVHRHSHSHFIEGMVFFADIEKFTAVEEKTQKKQQKIEIIASQFK